MGGKVVVGLSFGGHVYGRMAGGLRSVPLSGFYHVDSRGVETGPPLYTALDVLDCIYYLAKGFVIDFGKGWGSQIILT